MENHSPQNRILDTQRLKLIPFADEHCSGLNLLDSDPDVMRYIGDGRTKSAEETMEVIQKVKSRQQEFGFSWWAIVHKELGEIIGSGCLQHISNKPDAALEIGWRLRPDTHGKGYATEAGLAIIQYAFGTIGAPSVLAVANPENGPSQRVMQRLGMTYIGIHDYYDLPCVTYELCNPKGTG